MKSFENIIPQGVLAPIDVRIFYEDGIPYMEYTGVADSNIGKIQMHFPKVALIFDRIEEECTYADHIKLKHQVYMSRDTHKFYEIKILERRMTKKEIEDELGYKVKIIN